MIFSGFIALFAMCMECLVIRVAWCEFVIRAFLCKQNFLFANLHSNEFSYYFRKGHVFYITISHKYITGIYIHIICIKLMILYFLPNINCHILLCDFYSMSKCDSVCITWMGNIHLFDDFHFLQPCVGFKHGIMASARPS